MFGKNSPFQITDLPATSHLRKRLESLPEQQKQHAIARLHKFNFPEHDVDTIKVDDDGDVYYADTHKPPQSTAPALAEASTLTAIPAVDAFKLHSRPSATKKVFLDFDGHTITGTAWNKSVTTYNAVAFDLDNNPTNFNTDERNRIAEIWHRIAEDYAQFDIDVTTEAPASFGPTIGHVLFTKDTDSNGSAMPSQGAGGVGYVDVFGQSDYAKYSPALVYYNQLGSGFPPYLAEAGAHEFGHNLGLSHDGVLDGNQNTNCKGDTSYFCGLGSGNVSWAPIMGDSYSSNVTEWSKGEYPSANNTEDDISIIGQKLLFVSDDISNTSSGATPLRVETDGNILVTNPQNDSANTDTANKGIIQTTTDADTFWFETGAGAVTITATPAWAAFNRTKSRGANLDIQASITNQAGVQVASSSPSDETSATISTSLSAGRYFLTITGVNNTVTPYSDYGSVGEYFINGKVIPAAPDITAPTPNPMGFAVAPFSKGTSVQMTATTASDNSGSVLYQFKCIAGGQGCVTSAWQASTTYVATALASNAQYSYTVSAKDATGNTTAASPVASATTTTNLTPIATNDSASVNEDSSISIPVLSNDTDPNGDTLTISSVGSAKNGKATISGSSISYNPNANFSGVDSFSYTISDGKGGSATATVAVTVKAVNDAPTAVSDTAKVVIGKSVTITPLSNDTDVDKDTLTLASITSPTKGKAVISGNSVTYTAGSRSGTDTFTYTVTDGHGGKATSTISVTITKK